MIPTNRLHPPTDNSKRKFFPMDDNFNTTITSLPHFFNLLGLALGMFFTPNKVGTLASFGAKIF
jgi:hypothetical protein